VLGLGWASRRVPERPPARGLQSAVVPGYVAGLYELHKRYGAFEWGRVVDVALDAMAQATMHPSLVSAIEKSEALLRGDPGGRVYLELPRRPGAPYRIEPLLRLWERLRDGPLSFYDEVAEDVVALGHFEPEDFKLYRPEVRRPISVKLGDAVVTRRRPPRWASPCSLPPNSPSPPPPPSATRG